MAPLFTPATLRFLRGLNRHNDRIWFEERRPIYESAVKAPLLQLIEELNQELSEFAPEYVRPAHKVAMRIYRDIRFSPDKRPYKRHISAWWTARGLEKRSAGGFYLQIGPLESFFAAGVYAPERDDLLKLRRWLAEHHESYSAVLNPILRRRGAAGAMEPINANALTRAPKGFPAEHPAEALLRARNWGVLRQFPAESALDDGFAERVAQDMRRTFPVIALLNQAFAGTPASAYSLRRI